MSDVLKIKDWIKVRGQQFRVVANMEGSFGDKKIFCVRRLKDDKFFWLNTKINCKDYGDLYVEIIHFHEDLIHVTFVTSRKSDNRVVDTSTFEINSIQLDGDLFVRAMQKL